TRVSVVSRRIVAVRGMPSPFLRQRSFARMPRYFRAQAPGNSAGSYFRRRCRGAGSAGRLHGATAAATRARPACCSRTASPQAAEDGPDRGVVLCQFPDGSRPPHRVGDLHDGHGEAVLEGGEEAPAVEGGQRGAVVRRGEGAFRGGRGAAVEDELFDIVAAAL